MAAPSRLAVQCNGEPVRRQTTREECTEAEWSLAARLAEHLLACLAWWRLAAVFSSGGDGGGKMTHGERTNRTPKSRPIALAKHNHRITP
jgi:hypothetical protein